MLKFETPHYSDDGVRNCLKRRVITDKKTPPRIYAYMKSPEDEYLVWERSKHLVRSSFSDPSISTTDLLDHIEENKEKVAELNYEQKLKEVQNQSSGDGHRAGLFYQFSWGRKTFPLHALGTVLPVTGDLPPEVITDPLSEVVEYVQKEMNNNPQGESVQYIANLSGLPEILSRFAPIVVVPGSIQRNERIMRRYHGEPGWDVSPTEGYIEDGNHRALATAIATGNEEFDCHAFVLV